MTALMEPNHHIERLSATERHVLLLLGEGHTAKSIAILTGKTLASINEHLRQARRKTGAASSRELARQLTAQENRHEKIEIAKDAATVPSPQISRRTGVFVMSVISIAAIAAAALLSPQASAPKDEQATELPGGLLATSDNDAVQLAKKVRSEHRDDAWAAQAEQALRKRYATMVTDNSLTIDHVICAATVCEVLGSLPAQTDENLNATIGNLQATDNQIQEDAATGLENITVSFSRDNFVTYWRRPKSSS